MKLACGNNQIKYKSWVLKGESEELCFNGVVLGKCGVLVSPCWYLDLYCQDMSHKHQEHAYFYSLESKCTEQARF